MVFALLHFTFLLKLFVHCCISLSFSELFIHCRTSYPIVGANYLTLSSSACLFYHFTLQSIIVLHIFTFYLKTFFLNCLYTIFHCFSNYLSCHSLPNLCFQHFKLVVKLGYMYTWSYNFSKSICTVSYIIFRNWLSCIFQNVRCLLFQNWLYLIHFLDLSSSGSALPQWRYFIIIIFFFLLLSLSSHTLR